MKTQPGVKEITVAERKDGYPSVFYVSYSLPMFMNDRDSVFMMLRVQISDEIVAYLLQTTHHP